MTITRAKLFFWIVLGATLLVYFVSFANKNFDGTATYRTCIESSGGHSDPRSGDGPECEQYGMVSSEESVFRTGLRGIGEGSIPAIVLGLAAGYIGSKLDDRTTKSDKAK